MIALIMAALCVWVFTIYLSPMEDVSLDLSLVSQDDWIYTDCPEPDNQIGSWISFLSSHFLHGISFLNIHYTPICRKSLGVDFIFSAADLQCVARANTKYSGSLSSGLLKRDNKSLTP